MQQRSEIRRDKSDRVLGADGLPLGGLATVGEVVSTTGLSRSKVYDMIATDSIEVKRFGRSVRVPWHVVRRMVGVES